MEVFLFLGIATHLVIAFILYDEYSAANKETPSLLGKCVFWELWALSVVLKSIFSWIIEEWYEAKDFFDRTSFDSYLKLKSKENDNNI